jgi:threonine dehydrogenase-like Zn-dependent dehydrogenase
VLQVTIKKGNVLTEEVPVPVTGEKTLIIQVVNSCISAGTELSGIAHSGKSLVKRAIEQPEKINKAINYISNFGVQGFLDKIDHENSAKATGYSVSGIVVEVGSGIKKFKPGDRVAAAGSGYANHAEFIEVPENLAVKIPETLDFTKASSVTLGAIALQGVRRADLKLGEFCVVLGAGILGLLAVQMLASSGVRVITIDRDEHRLALAKEYGSELTINSANIDSLKEVELITGSHGADAVIFTAATTEADVISQAFKMCKRKGKVVLVGIAGDTIKRDDMYMKELDYIVSTSTGPGRYDSSYEEKGIDYPYDYVRWTENRNMSEYLRLLDKGLVNIDKMINGIFKIQDASTAFKSLTEAQPKPLMVILDYGNTSLKDKTVSRKIQVSDFKTKQGVINVGLIGAGNFASGVHLPNLKKLKEKFHIRAVVSSKGLKAKQTAEQYGANYATSD